MEGEKTRRVRYGTIACGDLADLGNRTRAISSDRASLYPGSNRWLMACRAPFYVPVTIN